MDSYHPKNSYPLEDNQTPVNPFDDQEQSIFKCLDLEHDRYHAAQSESVDEVGRSQDIIDLSLEQVRNATQETKETRMDLEQEHLQEDSQPESIKQNFCKFLAKKIRKIIQAQLQGDVPLEIACYLRFVVEKGNLKKTRKSLRQFLIKQPRPNLEVKFQEFLKQNMQQFSAKRSEILEKGTIYLQQLICSRQTQIKADVKTEEKRIEFRLFIQRTIKELRNNKMRLRDKKREKATKDCLLKSYNGPKKGKHALKHYKSINSGKKSELVDLQCSIAL